MLNNRSNHLMNEHFEIMGIWYLPDQKLNKDGISGVLRCSPAETRLDLLGIFESSEGDFGVSFAVVPKRSVIYGYSNLGERITLIDCSALSVQVCIPGFDTISYVVDHFYVGTQLIENENDKNINSCTFTFSYLGTWLDIGKMEEHISNDRKKLELSIDLNEAALHRKKIKVDSENIFIEEGVDFDSIFPNDDYLDKTYEIKLNRYYKIASLDNDNLSYNACIGCLHKIRKLLTLLIGSPLYFLYIDLKLPAIAETLSDGKEYIKNNSCRVYIRQVGDINKRQKVSSNNPCSILIYPKDIINCSEQIFKKWFELYEIFSEIVDSYISDMYLPVYQETRFLNIVRSLETYHRFFIEEKELSLDDESGKKIKTDRQLLYSFISDHIDDENKDYFIDSINYENENSLQRRLKMLFSGIPDELMCHLFGEINSKEKNKIVHRIVQTRNYFTHRDNKERYPFVIDDHKVLDNYIEKLGIILQYLVLISVGIEKAVVSAALVDYINYILMADRY